MAKNIPLQRYDDGTPSVLRRATIYSDLFFYRKSDTLVQITKLFCQRYLPLHGDRTVDQMIQAARSVKQNIAEGLTDGQTSFEVEIKLLGIAKGSNQELLEDYQDYLKHHHLPDWGKDDADAHLATRYNKMVLFCRHHNDLADYEPFFARWNDEEMANTAICLCHMIDKAMTSFIAKRDREFVEEGGIRERMTAARLDMRATQKQTIARLEAENTQLKAEISRLKKELETYKNTP